MKLGIDYTPTGLLADYCISCTNPETGKVGSWLFLGDSHKTGRRKRELTAHETPKTKTHDHRTK